MWDVSHPLAVVVDPPVVPGHPGTVDVERVVVGQRLIRERHRAALHPVEPTEFVARVDPVAAAIDRVHEEVRAHVFELPDRLRPTGLGGREASFRAVRLMAQICAELWEPSSFSPVGMYGCSFVCTAKRLFTPFLAQICLVADRPGVPVAVDCAPRDAVAPVAFLPCFRADRGEVRLPPRTLLAPAPSEAAAGRWELFLNLGDRGRLGDFAVRADRLEIVARNRLGQLGFDVGWQVGLRRRAGDVRISRLAVVQARRRIRGLADGRHQHAHRNGDQQPQPESPHLRLLGNSGPATGENPT